MSTFFRKLKLAVTDTAIRNRILFVLGGLFVFRALSAVPVPGIDSTQLEQFLLQNQAVGNLLGFFNIFSGGGLKNLSIIMLGVSPYITASITMQLLTVMSPQLKAMHTEEGETGRHRFTQYTRLLALPLGVLQGFGFLTLLQNQGVVSGLSTFDFMASLIVIVAGSLLLMWIGELLTEFGIGNGVSIIIFAGIVAGLPNAISQLLFTFDVSQLPLYLGFLAAALVVIYGVVIMTEAERSVPITHAKQVRGGKTYGGVSSYLPLRINQAGVIPIIFAGSVLLFPQMILQALSGLEAAWVVRASDIVLAFLANQLWYGVLYFILVFLFTYFYTAVTFDPDAISKNLQRSGAFIPGVRPGLHTAEYLGSVITRLTLVGALFLGIIAILPLLMQAATGFTMLALGGTALLIVVSVVLELIRRIDSQLSLREY
ncbi:preprotein translocase subunit SecY [Candidatus Kaiserbacteria bacterium]|nr:preprotein translocase subunit SecY [Candidatus Kaiserbacteria bacterium]